MLTVIRRYVCLNSDKDMYVLTGGMYVLTVIRRYVCLNSDKEVCMS